VYRYWNRSHLGEDLDAPCLASLVPQRARSGGCTPILQYFLTGKAGLWGLRLCRVQRLRDAGLSRMNTLPASRRTKQDTVLRMILEAKQVRSDGMMGTATYLHQSAVSGPYTHDKHGRALLTRSLFLLLRDSS
jgi:hypothetical protein